MQTTRVYSLALAIIIGWMVSGCASTNITGAANVDKQAFGAKKKVAVVSIASVKSFRGEQSFVEMFKNNDDIQGMNTQPILNKLDPKIINALGSSKNLILLSENTVLTSKAYKKFAEDARTMKVFITNETLNVANNYKYVSDEKKYAQLAKDLGVDGVIGITMNFTVSSSKNRVSIMGFTLGKKSYSVTAIMEVIAYNKDGKVIWKDSTMKEAEPGDTKAIILIDTSNLTATDFLKLHPSAIEMGGKAVDVLLARFDDTMAGKAVESIQSTK